MDIKLNNFKKEFIAMAREEFTMGNLITLKEEEAKQEGLQKGIQILISSLKDLDLSKDAIVLQLQKKISSNKRGSFILSKQINFVVA